MVGIDMSYSICTDNNILQFFARASPLDIPKLSPDFSKKIYDGVKKFKRETLGFFGIKRDVNVRELAEICVKLNMVPLDDPSADNDLVSFIQSLDCQRVSYSPDKIHGPFLDFTLFADDFGKPIYKIAKYSVLDSSGTDH